ncbi:MAG: hypothetical protein H7A24_01275 [Leptospiraceae bacterium]|nr:hypothetical protein [Leptospiraceae bacterium]MCP5510484.1 hypothetical protein [Leptospiraceae bacterium]
MKIIYLLHIIFVFNCATAHYLDKVQSNQDPELSEIIIPKDTIGILGFSPEANNKEKGNENSSLIKLLKIGKPLSELSLSSSDSDTDPKKLKDFFDKVKSLSDEDKILLFSGYSKTNQKDLKFIGRDMDYLIVGILGPPDISNQGNLDLSTGRSWLKIGTSFFSILTLGTLPALDYRETDSTILIYDRTLFKRGEMNSSNQVWEVSAWWNHFLDDRQDRVMKSYFYNQNKNEIYYKTDLIRTERLLRTILKKSNP